jgi:hypothetical protein
MGELYGLLKLFLAGVTCVALGLVLIFHPSLRTDPKTLSANEVAIGIAPIFIGCLLLTLVGLNLFWLTKRRDKPPPVSDGPEGEG